MATEQLLSSGLLKFMGERTAKRFENGFHPYLKVGKWQNKLLMTFPVG